MSEEKLMQGPRILLSWNFQSLNSWVTAKGTMSCNSKATNDMERDVEELSAKWLCWWPPCNLKPPFQLPSTPCSNLSSRETTCLRKSTGERLKPAHFPAPLCRNSELVKGMIEIKWALKSLASKACMSRINWKWIPQIFSMFVQMFVGRGGDKNRGIGTLLPPDCAMPSTTAGSDESWEGSGCQAEPRQGTIADSCSSFHHYKVWKGPLSSPENSRWLSNSHGSCYRVIGCDFSKPHFTLSLRHCQLSPRLQRERMEPGWRRSKHAPRLCVFPPLETTLQGGEGVRSPWSVYSRQLRFPRATGLLEVSVMNYLLPTFKENISRLPGDPSPIESINFGKSPFLLIWLY